MLSRTYEPRFMAFSAIFAAFRQNTLSRRLIISLFAFNIAFIVVNFIAEGLRFIDPDRYSLESVQEFTLWREGGYAEIFNYLQSTICVALLFGLFAVSRSRLYGIWAFVFMLIMVDDAFAIHEHIGRFLVATSSIPSLLPLEAQDAGELLAFAGMGLLVLPLLAWALMDRSAKPVTRMIGSALALTFAALIFFGVGVDMLGAAFRDGSDVISGGLTALEDGGEMLAIAMTCSIALLAFHCEKSNQPALASPAAV